MRSQVSSECCHVCKRDVWPSPEVLVKGLEAFLSLLQTCRFLMWWSWCTLKTSGFESDGCYRVSISLTFAFMFLQTPQHPLNSPKRSEKGE